MSTEQNQSIVYRWVEEAWNQGNFSSARELYPPTYQLHDPSAPQPIAGPDGLAGMITAFRSGMPDFHMTVEQAVSEGEMVAWRFRAEGSQTGELLGFPASNRRVSITGMVMSRFEKGKWVEDYANWDVLTMLQQIGVIAEMARK